MKQGPKRIMMNKYICLAFGLCNVFVTGVRGTITQRPLNAATSVDGQIAFNCSSNNAVITWTFTIECNALVGQTLTASNCDINSSYAAHYRTEKSSGGFNCNLIVFDAVLSLGGCYACADGFGTGNSFQAMLIVVDTNANMTSNSADIVSGDDVTISNSVSYRGPSIPSQQSPLPPQFYWTSQTDPKNITSYQGSTTNTIASSYIIVKANPPNVGPYTCNIFFNPPTFVPLTCANNNPIYSKSWESPTQSVSYPPENAVILGIPNPCLHEAVELVCSASGHPIPTYKWFNLTNMAVISDMNTVRIERGGSYQCVASNTIRNVPHNASTSVYVSDCETPHNVSITASSGPCPDNDDSCDTLNSDTLTCKASGFPEPEYEWSYSGRKEAGDTVVARKNIGYQCTATNHYADQYHSASSTIYVNWLTVLICDPLCIAILVIVIFCGLNLLFFTVFIICYGCSKTGRNTLNDRFPWLRKMLRCINDEESTCSVWIFYFVILSIFVAFVFFPAILIMAICCKTKKKTSKSPKSADIDLHPDGYIEENDVRPNILTETAPYESLQRATEQSTTPFYEELKQGHHDVL